jgi:hypothetical protein
MTARAAFEAIPLNRAHSAAERFGGPYWSRYGETAISEVVWEGLNEMGEVTKRWERGPLRFHCVFRFEMEHLLLRAGHDIQALYGDFFQHDLQDDSSEMVWVARLP